MFEVNHYRSEVINEIMAALAKAQGLYEPLKNNCKNKRGESYANLQAVLNATRKGLSENGLGFSQHIEIIDKEGMTLLVSTVGHSSGQHLGSCVRLIIGKTDLQTSNIIEIHKRIQAMMLLGVAANPDDPYSYDDNGEEQNELQLMEQIKTPRIAQKNYSKDTVSKDQYNELLIELEGYPEVATDIMKYYEITTLDDIPREEYHKVRNRILNIKKTYEQYNNRNK